MLLFLLLGNESHVLMINYLSNPWHPWSWSLHKYHNLELWSSLWNFTLHISWMDSARVLILSSNHLFRSDWRPTICFLLSPVHLWPRIHSVPVGNISNHSADSWVRRWWQEDFPSLVPKSLLPWAFNFLLQKLSLDGVILGTLNSSPHYALIIINW